MYNHEGILRAMLGAFALAVTGLFLSGCVQFPTQNSQHLADAVFEIRLDKGHGTGFHVGNGFVLTAAHVVAPKGEALTMRAIDGDGRVRSLDLLWSTTKYDVALLRVSQWQSLKTISLDCDTAEIGRKIIAHGYPLSAGRQAMNGFVSSPPDEVGNWKSAFGMDLTALPGMSGGPVVASSGQAVGITVGVRTVASGFSSSFTGLSVAVPMSTVCTLLGRAERGA